MKAITYSLITGIIILYSNFCISQVTGKCIDTLGSSVPFINVGVKMTSLGTVTDENGIFHLTGDLLNDIDSLVISHIGYVPQTICSNRKDTIVVVLQPSEYQLREVNISASESIYKNEKIIGTKVSNDHVVLSFLSNHLGSEIGKLIKVKKERKYKIEKVFFTISELNYKKATFRINFYNVKDENNIEKQRVNFNDIIKDVYKSGLVEIDVENENLEFENDFLVTIEWIEFIDNDFIVPEKEKNIFFNSTVFSGPPYFRSNNLIKWSNRKSKYNIGIGIHLSVKY